MNSSILTRGTVTEQMVASLPQIGYYTVYTELFYTLRARGEILKQVQC